jgi:hypothetical protein
MRVTYLDRLIVNAHRTWHQKLKRPQIHLTNAETLDGTIDKGSNHPKMEGFFPCLPLNPLPPRADGDAMAAGFKKR